MTAPGKYWPGWPVGQHGHRCCAPVLVTLSGPLSSPCFLSSCVALDGNTPNPAPCSSSPAGIQPHIISGCHRSQCTSRPARPPSAEGPGPTERLCLLSRLQASGREIVRDCLLCSVINSGQVKMGHRVPQTQQQEEVDGFLRPSEQAMDARASLTDM